MKNLAINRVLDTPTAWAWVEGARGLDPSRPGIVADCNLDRIFHLLRAGITTSRKAVNYATAALLRCTVTAWFGSESKLLFCA